MLQNADMIFTNHKKPNADCQLLINSRLIMIVLQYASVIAKLIKFL